MECPLIYEVIIVSIIFGAGEPLAQNLPKKESYVDEILPVL